MKKLTLIVFAMLLVFQHTVAFCASKHPPMPDLKISWTVITNHYDNKDQTLAKFSISNQSLQRLPASGWKIYFNYNRNLAPQQAQNQLGVKNINGGLYYLYPQSTFTGLEKGGQADLLCISNSWVVNLVDAPQGFYLVWDDEPLNGIPLTNYDVNPPANPAMLKRFANDNDIPSSSLYAHNELAKKHADDVQCPIFPTPASYTLKKGFFTIDEKVKITCDDSFKNEAKLLTQDVEQLLGKNLTTANGTQNARHIILSKDIRIAKGYTLVVSPTSITITAGSAANIFYGIQSLKSLINPPYYRKASNSKAIPVKCVEVTDYPAFEFRAVMVDVARNFQPEHEILRLIDLLALYKFNKLHLHLNDDEGWRLEIPQIPELTSVGANRGTGYINGTTLPPAYGSGPKPNVLPGSGYYSKKQFINILKYAAKRHINVIPEIETPGHARAAIRSMEARYKRLMAFGDSVNAKKYLLQSFSDTSKYRSVQQWNDNVIDVSMPSAYTFLTTVTDEIINMYKEAGAELNTIHFGGDEVPAGVWQGSPEFQALRKRDTTINSTQALWNHFYSRINTMLKQRGLYLSGWEETGLTKTTVAGRKRWVPNPLFAAENFHVNVWNNLVGNEDLAYRLANGGYKVVLSFVTHFYFDMAYVKHFDEPGFNWGGFIDLEQPFKFIPYDYLRNQHTDYLGRPLSKNIRKNSEQLTETGKQNIIGIQGLLWSETVKTPQRLEFMYLPRLLALAERAWVQQPAWMQEQDSVKAAGIYNTDWATFTNKAGRELKRLDYYQGGYEYRVPTPAILTENHQVKANTEIPGLQIRFTTDGSQPNNRSKLYTGPVPFQKGLIFRAFTSTGRGGRSISLAEAEPSLTY